MTTRRLRRPIPIVLATVLLSGCAKVTPLKPVQLGTVGIVSTARADVEKRGSLPIPGAAAGAIKGAEVAGGGMIETGFELVRCCGHIPPFAGLVGGLVIIALAPIAAGVGSIIGAIGADSAEEVARADSTLRAAFAQLEPAKAVRTQLLEVISKHTLATIVMMGEAWVPGLSDFSSLQEDGIDTILELYDLTLSLTVPNSSNRQMNPDHEFKMEIKARLIRPDGTALHGEAFAVRKKRSFVDWAARDARDFRAVTDRATRKLAEDIVNRYLRKPVLVQPGLSNLPPSRPNAW